MDGAIHGCSMPGWKERVCIEQKELADKYLKLDKFLEENRENVPTDELRRLQQQKFIMGQYLTILEARIARF